jgi:Protein of unknown function (DUF3175)
MRTVRQRKQNSRKWSADVTENSNALDLDEDVFKNDSPAEIARSLKKSAERSDRRKSSPFHSAMSMLTFYINRAGKNLSSQRKGKLEAAKSELRRVFQISRAKFVSFPAKSRKDDRNPRAVNGFWIRGMAG